MYIKANNLVIFLQRQIDIYKLQPNTSYAFRIWATNQLGSGEITEVVATTLGVYQEQGTYLHILSILIKYNSTFKLINKNSKFF